MSETIEDGLKKLAENTPKASSQTTSNTRRPSPGLGDPDCPHCGGVGYLRRDLPVNHPDFGRVAICDCRQAQEQARVRRQLYQLSDLDELAHLTFDSFDPSGRIGVAEQAKATLERAYNLAMMFADEPSGWLLLQGAYGCGKTHLAAAVANHAVSLGHTALFLTVPDLLDSLRQGFNEPAGGFEARFERIRGAPILVLDDFGTQNATDWAREKLFQILNHRYINKLPTVITTNLALAELEGRMRSRLSDPELVTTVHILAPDYRRPTEDMGHSELSSLSHHEHQTFGTFSLRKSEKMPREDTRSLQRAFEAARDYAETPAGWLVFTGPYGVGKTHLAAAIANYRFSQGFPVTFVVTPDLLDHLRATFNPKSEVSYDRRFETLRTAPLLILDDLGTQATSQWAREKLYQLFNYRYNAELPTVITTADTIETVDERLRTRMLDGRVCRIHAITTAAYRSPSG